MILTMDRLHVAPLPVFRHHNAVTATHSLLIDSNHHPTGQMVETLLDGTTHGIVVRIPRINSLSLEAHLLDEEMGPLYLDLLTRKTSNDLDLHHQLYRQCIKRLGMALQQLRLSPLSCRLPQISLKQQLLAVSTQAQPPHHPHLMPPPRPPLPWPEHSPIKSFHLHHRQVMVRKQIGPCSRPRRFRTPSRHLAA